MRQRLPHLNRSALIHRAMNTLQIHYKPFASVLLIDNGCMLSRQTLMVENIVSHLTPACLRSLIYRGQNTGLKIVNVLLVTWKISWWRESYKWGIGLIVVGWEEGQSYCRECMMNLTCIFHAQEFTCIKLHTEIYIWIYLHGDCFQNVISTSSKDG